MRLLMFMVIFLKLALTWTHYREWFVACLFVCKDLSYNSLTGPVPQLLSELPALEILNLTSNSLTVQMAIPIFVSRTPANKQQRRRKIEALP
ncbi:unnamed protein product [Camellia sinensis]